MAERREIINIRCIAKYPKLDEGKRSLCFIIDPEDAARIETACNLVNDRYDSIVGEVDIDDHTYLCVNAHTNEDFKIPIFDGKTGKESEENEIFHDADVIVSLVIKEYQYKKKRGLTAYIRGFVLFKQGVPSGVTFESMFEGIDE